MSGGPNVAIVTGASTGIGRAIAVALGGLGWRVALGARRTDKLDETATLVIEAGGEAFPRLLDVTDATSVDTFVTDRRRRARSRSRRSSTTPGSRSRDRSGSSRPNRSSARSARTFSARCSAPDGCSRR